MDKLRALKVDKGRMEEFDKDGDGNIDGLEWEDAKSHIRDEILNEKLASTGGDKNIEVGQHPSGGLFVISGKHEDSIIKSLVWRVPLTLILGITGIVFGLFYMPKLINLINLLL